LLWSLLPFTLMSWSIWFVYSKYHVADLGSTGGFLAGLASLLAVLYSKNYLSEQRFVAASEALALFRSSIGYIIEIVESPYNYQHEDYYPFRHPEKKISSPKDSGRPYRLIYNELGEFRNKMNGHIGKIHGEEASQLIHLISELERIVRSIGGYLQAELGDHPERGIIKLNYPDSEKYKEQLQDILVEAEKILAPVIKS
jgi:hypothetical protein